MLSNNKKKGHFCKTLYIFTLQALILSMNVRCKPIRNNLYDVNQEINVGEIFLLEGQWRLNLISVIAVVFASHFFFTHPFSSWLISLMYSVYNKFLFATVWTCVNVKGQATNYFLHVIMLTFNEKHQPSVVDFEIQWQFVWCRIQSFTHTSSILIIKS